MQTIVTGFNEFGGLKVNPARLVVEELMLRRRGLGGPFLAEVLPTEFAEAGERVRHLIQRCRPDVFLIIGVASGCDAINLERVALNLDDADEPDNAGSCPSGRLIDLDGPLAYFSTLPLMRLKRALTSRDIPVRVSNHAGTFVCNHAHYVARRQFELMGLDGSCGLIHIPLMTEQLRAASPVPPSMPISRIVEAVELCISECELSVA